MTARAVLMQFILVSGCVFPKLDYEGKRCDPAVGCPAPWHCVKAGADWACRDGAGPSETCNGLDDDGNGKVDDVSGCIVTLAGSGSPALLPAAGAAPLPSTEAAFAGPQFLTAARDGGYYVADGYNHAVRRVHPDGTVETIAGTGKCGFIDGPVATAQFCVPVDVAVADDGTLFVSDSLNHRIRKISGGEVSTLAGGDAGFLDSAMGPPLFNQPSGLDWTPDGGLLVADTFNHRIRWVDPASGAVSTYLGSGVRGNANGNEVQTQLALPRDVLWVGNGVFIAEEARVRRFTSTGGSYTFAGDPDGGSGSRDTTEGFPALFDGLRQLTVLNGNLIVADLGNNGLRHISTAMASAGTTTRFAGIRSRPGFQDGPKDVAALLEPAGVLALGGVLLFTDANHRVRRLEGDPLLNTTTTVTGGAPRAETADGPATSQARLSMTGALALQTDGTLVWTEPGRHLLRQLTPDGGVWTLVGTPGAEVSGYVDGPVNRGAVRTARMNAPTGVVAHPDGRLFIAEWGNRVVRVVAPDGGVSTFAAGPAGGADGPRLDSGFNAPTAIALAPPGVNPPALYVADTGAHVVRRVRFDIDWVERVAGITGDPGSDNGALDAGRLDSPGALAVTRSGDVFVVDGSRRNTIRQLSPNGVLSTAFADLEVPIAALVEDDAEAGTLLAVGRERILRLTPATGAVLRVALPSGRATSIGMQDGDAETEAGLWNLTGIAISPEAIFLADGYSRRIRQLWR